MPRPASTRDTDDDNRELGKGSPSRLAIILIALLALAALSIAAE